MSGATYPDWSGVIRNHYWHLRYCRDFHEARRRKEYRRIEAEKKRLVQAGVDPEGIRLLCRHLVNLKNQNAERRWINWNLASQQAAACPVRVTTGHLSQFETLSSFIKSCLKPYGFWFSAVSFSKFNYSTFTASNLVLGGGHA